MFGGKCQGVHGREICQFNTDEALRSTGTRTGEEENKEAVLTLS